MKSRTKRNLITTVVLVVIAALLADFRSAALPPPLEMEQRTLLESTQFPYTIAVETDEDPVYSDHLIRALRTTGLFDSVVRVEDASDPDLFASVDRQIHGTATIPLVTGLTLGFFPTVVEEEWGEVFTLSSPDRQRLVPIDFTYSGPTTLGWLATFLNISPDRTSDNPRETDRFHDALAHQICVQAERIHSLTTSGPTEGRE